jgi:hypothetical protein
MMTDMRGEGLLAYIDVEKGEHAEVGIHVPVEALGVEAVCLSRVGDNVAVREDDTFGKAGGSLSDRRLVRYSFANVSKV